MTPLQSVERELAANAASLRALASDLVGRDQADDLVQETALRALRMPPPQPAGLGGWLATVLRRLAGNHRRDARRRQQREHAAAAPDRVPAVDDTVARRESLRTVTLALLTLPEPYQTTLLQRYFEGLSPAAIAARAGVPVATVKSRLQRGLAQLRDQLDRGDRARWRPALALAVGLCQPTISTLIGTALMANTAKFAAGAAALFGALLLWWQLDAAPDAPPLPTAPSTAAAAASAVPAGELPAPADPLAREPAELVPAVLPGLEHPFGYALLCRVIDTDGLPVTGARLAMAPAGCAMNRWPERTAADGTATLRWRSRLPHMRVVVGLVADGAAAGMRELELDAGSEAELVLLGEVRSGVRLRLVATKGADQALALTLVDVEANGGCAGQTGDGSQDCRACHADTPFARGLFDDRLQVRTGLHPDATFADLLLAPMPLQNKAEESLRILAARSNLDAVRQLEKVSSVIELRGSGDLFANALSVKFQNAVGELAEGAAAGNVTGTVFGEDGQPVAGATVIWSTTPDQPNDRTRTKKDGSYRLEGVRAGQVEIRAGGRDGGLGRILVQVAAGAETQANVHLRRAATIRGRAVGGDGTPLGGWRVECQTMDGRWCDAAVVRKDGAFELPNLPGGPCRLLLWPQENARLPVAIEPAVLPDSGEVLFDLRQRGAPAGSLRVRCVLPPDLAGIHAEVRVFDQEGRGTPMPQTKGGDFVLEGLPAGFYKLEFGAESLGWLELGQHWVDGKGPTDLGTVRLDAPATLLLTQPTGGGDQRALELYHRRPEGDVRVAPEIGAANELRLPAGKWLCLWRDADTAVQQREFSLPPGGTFALDLTAGPR